MTNPNYQTLYQRAYRKLKRQVTITLEPALYKIWLGRAEASDRSVPGQILAEAEANRQNIRLPSRADEQDLRELIRLTRNIANNLNQVAHSSNRFNRLLEERRARQLLAEFEASVTDFIHRHPIPKETHNGGD